MKTLLRDLLTDLKAGRNVDTIVVVLLTAVIAILTLFNVTSQRVAISLVLALLVIITAKTLMMGKAIDRIAQTASLPAALPTFRDEDYASTIERATRISLLTITNFRFLAANSDTFHRYLQRGGEMRQILMNPDSSESMYSATTRAAGSSQDKDHTRSQVQLAVDKLYELAGSAISDAKLQAKRTDYATAHVISWFEFERESGRVFVTPSGFRQRTGTRPTIVVNAANDPGSYEYFTEYFENIWNWRGSAIIDLTADNHE